MHHDLTDLRKYKELRINHQPPNPRRVIGLEISIYKDNIEVTILVKMSQPQHKDERRTEYNLPRNE